VELSLVYELESGTELKTETSLNTDVQPNKFEVLNKKKGLWLYSL